MNDQTNEPEKDNERLGFNNLGVQIVEIGEDEGLEDHTIRPLRESLHKLIRPEDLPPSSGQEKTES